MFGNSKEFIPYMPKIEVKKILELFGKQLWFELKMQCLFAIQIVTLFFFRLA